MRRYLRSSAVNGPVWARGYTRAMMTKSFLTICAAVAAGTAAGTSLALAQSYPPPPGAVYSTPSPPYVPGGYPADYRRGPGGPDFDALEDDEAPNTAALPPDDPRYGRPDGPPPVIYSDRAPGDRPPGDNGAPRPPEAVGGAPGGVTG